MDRILQVNVAERRGSLDISEFDAMWEILVVEPLTPNTGGRAEDAVDMLPWQLPNVLTFPHFQLVSVPHP